MDKPARKKTNIIMDADLLRRMKVRAAENDTTLTEVFEQAAREYLAREIRPAKR